MDENVDGQKLAAMVDRGQQTATMMGQRRPQMRDAAVIGNRSVE